MSLSARDLNSRIMNPRVGAAAVKRSVDINRPQEDAFKQDGETRPARGGETGGEGAKGDKQTH